MGFVKTLAPPANLGDFDAVHRASWSRWMSQCFDDAIAALGEDPASAQFFNPLTSQPKGDVAQHVIAWNAFPKDLIRCFGRERAMKEADRLWPVYAYDTDPGYLRTAAAAPVRRSDLVFRPQSEYCEWHVTRDPGTRRIRRVTFTVEPPEYWMAMYGTLCRADFAPPLKDKVLALYQTHVAKQVTGHALRAKDSKYGLLAGPSFFEGDYNPFNYWNTRGGIMHLCCPPNSLRLQFETAATGTLPYHYGGRARRPLTYPDALSCGAGLGSPNRNSDPTIASTFNALARLGAQVSLADPAGIYIDRIDTNGWEMPGGISPRACWRSARGGKGMISRLVVEVPPESGYTLSDLRIGGVPLRYGGQLAECVTVKLVAQVVLPKTLAERTRAAARPTQPGEQRYAILRSNPTEILGEPADPASNPFDVAFGAYR